MELRLMPKSNGNGTACGIGVTDDILVGKLLTMEDRNAGGRTELLPSIHLQRRLVDEENMQY